MKVSVKLTLHYAYLIGLYAQSHTAPSLHSHCLRNNILKSVNGYATGDNATSVHVLSQLVCFILRFSDHAKTYCIHLCYIFCCLSRICKRMRKRTRRVSVSAPLRVQDQKQQTQKMECISILVHGPILFLLATSFAFTSINISATYLIFFYDHIDLASKAMCKT